MWEVGGIKIERTRARNIFLCLCTEIGVKVFFSVPKNFEGGIFLGPVPTESLRTQDSENIVGFGDRTSVSKLWRLKVRS